MTKRRFEISDEQQTKLEEVYRELTDGGKKDTAEIRAEYIRRARDVLGHERMDQAWEWESKGDTIEIVRVGKIRKRRKLKMPEKRPDEM